MHSSAAWFYYQDELKAGASVRLGEDEAAHAAGSKRLREGDGVVVFDGMGIIAQARIAAMTKRGGLDVEILSIETAPPLRPAITVASAVPKGERAATLLNMITQLGVSEFIPLASNRSVATGAKLTGERGRRIVIEACKQARCAHLPTLSPPMSPMEAATRAADADGMALAAHPAGLPLREVVDHHSVGAGAITLLIGPEGGFTEDEVDAMRGGSAQIVTLGRNILRTETACIAMLGFMRMYMR